MTCPHGRKSEGACLYCLNQQTNKLLARQVELQITEANKREQARLYRDALRHEYMKFIKEAKNQFVNFGNGEIKVDSADAELYWREFREWNFKEINARRNVLQDDIPKRQAAIDNLLKKYKYLELNWSHKFYFGLNLVIIILCYILVLILPRARNFENVFVAIPQFTVVVIFFGLVGLIWGILKIRHIKNISDLKDKATLKPLMIFILPAMSAFSAFLILGRLLLGAELILGVIFIGFVFVWSFKGPARVAAEKRDVVDAKKFLASEKQQLEELPSEDLMRAVRELN